MDLVGHKLREDPDLGCVASGQNGHMVDQILTVWSTLAKYLIPVKIGEKCSSKMPCSVCYSEWRVIGHTYFADPLLQCDLGVKSSQLLQLCSSALPSPMSPKIKSVGQWSDGNDKDINAYHR